MPDIKIKSLEGKDFTAYCALPPGGNGPALLVIQEIFGVNAAMRTICDSFASKGYIALCPDLFWRQQPGIQLTDKTPQEWDRAFELLKGFDMEAGLRDLISSIAHLRSMPGSSGKVGTVGYCLGGRLAFLVAARSDVDASVSYYGVSLDQLLSEVYDIRTPLLVHIAGKDEYVPPPIRQKILTAFAKNPVISTYVYDDADHAFARPNGKNFKTDAAALANKRTDDFFTKYLKN